jgi:hypothetical protein
LYRPYTQHSGAPYRRKYDPARQKYSHGSSTPKINRQETNVINGQTHTAYEYNEKRKENPHQKKDNIQRKINIMLQDYKKIQGSLITNISE